MTASVTVGSTPVTRGEISLCDAAAKYCSDIHLLGTAQLTSLGVAVFRITPGVGTHTYKAVFHGTATSATSFSATQSLSVTAANLATTTAVTVKLAGNTSQGIPGYTFQGKVSGFGNTGLAPSGQVQFLDVTSANAVVGSAVLTPSSTAFSMVSGTAPSFKAGIVATGDFNNDGHADIVALDGSGNLNVALGNGDGTFQSLNAAQLLSYTFVSAISAGDFNADGNLDLAICSSGNNLTILLGKGDGTFTVASSPSVEKSPDAMALGDFNSDGILDLAVTNGQSSDVSVLLGNGDGTFTSAAPVITTVGPGSIVTADFDGDGVLDLAVLTYANYTVSIYPGNGDGTFTAVSTPAYVGFDLDSLATADLNGDGAADILVSGFGFGAGPIPLLGHANGTFTAGTPPAFTAVMPTGRMVVADFNGDGIADMAALNSNSLSATGPYVFLGNGDGTFVTSGPFAGLSSESIVLADFNGDGSPDLVFVNGYATYSQPLMILLSESGLTATSTPTPVSVVGTGAHQLKAFYPGDTNFAASSSVASGLVAYQITPVLTLAATPTSASPGQQILLTATLTPYAEPGLSTNGESVSFYSGTSFLGSAALSSGVASINVASLSPGVNSLAVHYGGDADFLAVVSSLSFTNTQSNTANPTFSLAPGTYTSAQTVAISDTTAGAVIYYTTNGTVPTVASTVYAGPITVGSTTLLRAISVAPGYSISGIASATYSIIPLNIQPPLRFIPITPCRVADTRDAPGPFGGPILFAGSTREFDIPQSSCGIPPTAMAYSLNVTVVPRGPLGYLTIWPAGLAQPLASTLNSDGRVKANAAIIASGTGGVKVYVSSASHFILDINGYFVAASTPNALAFYPVTPCRIADTRNATGALGGPFIPDQGTRSFPVQSGPCGIPSTAQAYSLNVTAVPRGNILNYLTSWPTGQPQPNVSTLNASTGAVTANASIVPAGTNGDVSFYASDASDVVLDINGYFAPPGPGGLSLYADSPCRVIDTRSSSGLFNGAIAIPFAASGCASSSAQAYVVNATVVPPGPVGYVSLWADSQAQPLVSTLNANDGAITSNLAIVPVVNSKVDAFTSSPNQLILDISSYFAP